MLAVTNEIDALGYGLATAAFAVLLALLLTSWRGHTQGLYLLFAVGVSLLWAIISTIYAYLAIASFSLVLFLADLAMIAAWLIVLLKLFSRTKNELVTPKNKKFLLWFCCLAGGTLLLLVLASTRSFEGWFFQPLLAGFVSLSVFGLVLIEQIFYSAKKEKLWAIKFLVIGIGALFTFNFYFYADALLFNRFDTVVWYVRGYAVVLLVPLIAVFVARNPQWSFDVFISRGVVFHSATLMVVGSYLLIMAAGGYYIQVFGGDWGRAFQVLFFFGALLLLVFMLLSGRFRSSMRVLVDKHFFNYKYDYREEWQGFTKTLSGSVNEESDMHSLVLRALLDIVDSPEGVIWVASGGDSYVPVASVGMVGFRDKVIDPDDSLVLFLAGEEWVINVDEYRSTPEIYLGLELPDWLLDSHQGWLLAPLIERERLIAMVLFSQPRSKRSFNWEDSDLLKAAGRQAAVSLSQHQMGQALLEARQFEAFNRFSTFIVHDIKNMVAQLSLMVRNAEKHRHNPEFVDDMIETTKNSVNKMERMLAQLRTGKESFFKPEESRVNIQKVLAALIAEKSEGEPRPRLGSTPDEAVFIKAEKERLVIILGHLVQNAIDATPEEGEVEVCCFVKNNDINITVQDTGVGMSEAFIRDYLFRPFYTTKGDAGMGIGVYESREYISQIKGRLEVESEVGKGSAFHVILPMEMNDSGSGIILDGMQSESARGEH